MSKPDREIERVHRAEQRDVALAAVAYIAFCLVTGLAGLEKPLDSLSFGIYVLLVVILAGRYLPWMRSWWVSNGLMPIDWLMLLAGAGLCFTLEWGTAVRAAPFFYLVALEGCLAFKIDDHPAYRRGWVTAIIALSLVGNGLAGSWEFAWHALLQDLPGYLLVLVVAELLVRQSIYRIRTERLLMEMQGMHRQLQDYTERSEQLVVAQERTRIAREIHDTLGHTLTALDVIIELLVRLPPDQSAQRQAAMDQARKLVKDGLSDLRRAVQALRPGVIETFSISEAISSLVAEFCPSARLVVDWQVEGAEAALPPRLSLPIYRAAQEALTNICRHARASRVVVRLIFSADTVTLRVEDNGCGGEPTFGMGLRGLQERAEALHGHFQAGPRPEGGFRVELILPR